jgi:hypothetical protein
MKAKFTLIGVGISAICLVGILIYSSQQTKQADRFRDAAQKLAQSKGKTSTAQAISPEQQFNQYMDFDRDVRRFLRNQNEMTPAERIRQARALAQRVDARQKSRHLSAGEALKLHMTLINASEPDEQKKALQIAELIVRYQADAERQQAEFVASQKRDPRFQAYKTREAQIVAEVQAMRSFPAGMSRDEYLRQRLFEARAAIYSTEQPGEQFSGPAQPPTQ